eukprot:4308991-Prorocentrum_lima.AAC.1
MTSSLVGSEMCIRDSIFPCQYCTGPPGQALHPCWSAMIARSRLPLSSLASPSRKFKTAPFRVLLRH